MLFVNILIMVVCGLIFWEDMVSRMVHWFLFPLLALLLLINSVTSTPSISLISSTLCNSVFLFVQLILLTAYMWFKKRQLVNILDYGLGLGDIFFLLALCFYFSFFNYLLFYILSLLLVIITWGIMSAGDHTNKKHIPLAGLQAGIFAIVFLAGWLHPQFRLNNNDWLLNGLLLWK